MLLWASKFAMTKIEYSFANGQVNISGGTIYFVVDGLFLNYD